MVISENPFPKIEPLPGSLHIEWRRCGRPACRCSRGQRHGPYYARRWRENGRQRKAYVRERNVAATLVAIELHKAMFPSISGITASLNRVSAKGGLT